MSVILKTSMQILIVQTAFIGDVILATPVIEKLHRFYPEASIDFLLRKGNEGLVEEHPLLRHVIIWDKKGAKYRNLFRIINQIRATRYDYVINLQRFFSTGLITAFSAGVETIGFDKNPLSVTFSKRIKHQISKEGSSLKMHEVERNLLLIEILTDKSFQKPRLYPSTRDFEKVKRNKPYVCIAPTSVWYTKQWPSNKWIDLIGKIDKEVEVLLLGAKSDFDACEQIRLASGEKEIENLAGKLSFLQSAALIAGAQMSYVNDSAPLHLASAMDAPVTAVFCSTIPAFGFGPLSTNSRIVEVKEPLSCRPCGLHGYKKCPEGHFKCAEISIDYVLEKS